MISLSKDAGKYDSFSDAVGLLGKSFEGDSRQLKEKYLTQFLQECKNSESLKSAIGEAIESARANALENRFSEATTLLTSADVASKRLISGGPVKLTVTEAKKWTANRETQWKAFQKASASLLKAPDDPEANWTVGRWHVCVENWKLGLPFLAKGNNVQWKAASELELNASSENSALVAVADAWWEIGQNDKSDAKTIVLKHAGEWYSRALPGTASLQKLRIEKRINEIGDSRPNVNQSPVNKTPALTPTTVFEDPVEIFPAGLKASPFGGAAATRFVDWNADGEPDLLVGVNGNIWLLMNSGKGKLNLPVRILAGIGDSWTTVDFADMNGDSKADLIVGHSDVKVVMFENKGSVKVPRFDDPKPLQMQSGGVLKLETTSRSRIGVGDWDGDGDMDLVAGRYEGPLTCYRNVGTARLAKFADGVPLEISGTPRSFAYNTYPTLFDVNQDGILDIIYGMNWGTMELLIAEKTPPVDKTLASGAPIINRAEPITFVPNKNSNLRLLAGDDATPTIADFDGDGVMDIVSGGALGKLWLLRGIPPK